MTDLLYWVECTSCSQYLGYFLLEGAADNSRKEYEKKTGHKAHVKPVELKPEPKEEE